MLFYRAALPLSSRTLTFVAGLIRRHRAAIGSPWRKLNPARQALLVLAYLRKGDTFAELAAGFDVGTTTAWRYVSETAALLAARAPKLRTAVRDAARAGYAYVVLDGTLIPVDRVAADRPFYSGKHKKHGDEPAGHRQPRRRHPVGVRGACWRSPSNTGLRARTQRQQPADPVRGQPSRQRNQHAGGGGVGLLQVINHDQQRGAVRGFLESFLQLAQQPEPLVRRPAEIVKPSGIDRRVFR
jgi:hypothetical protein